MQREQIEMRDSNSLPGNMLVDPNQGEFLILDRFFHRDYREGKEFILVYNVQHKMTPGAFYQMLGVRDVAVCTADEVSDHLVRAFDMGLNEKLGLPPALFAYRAPDGRLMHQHST